MFSTRNFRIFLMYQLSIHYFLSNQKLLVDIPLQMERLRFSVTVEEQMTLLNRYYSQLLKAIFPRLAHDEHYIIRLYTLGINGF